MAEQKGERFPEQIQEIRKGSGRDGARLPAGVTGTRVPPLKGEV